ncbi:MAG: hypothetical protein ABJM29_18915 [Rhizobiaceae bacterium]
MSCKFINLAAAAFMLASTSQALAGNYSTGVQLGSEPTAAQQAFHEDQMRIRHQGDFLHESEHRNGGTLVIKVTKSLWHKFRQEVYRKRVEWLPPPKYQHEPYH